MDTEGAEGRAGTEGQWNRGYRGTIGRDGTVVAEE